MVKLQDVAQHAGVSTATVSLVLSGKSEGRVSRKTSERVRAAAKDLGYVGNAAASSLRTRNSNTIGFLSDFIASTPYAVRMIESANRVAAEDDQLLILVNTEGSRKNEEFAVEEFVRRGVNGTVIAAMFHRKVDVPAKLGANVVILDGYSADPTIPAVVPDERQGIADVMGLLIDAGHQRIAYLGETERIGSAALLRRDAYREAMSAAGLEVEDGWEAECEPSTLSAVSAAEKLLREARPTAVCCYNDLRAHAVYRAAGQQGLRIPQDLSVVGFDNQEMIAPLLDPPLTTVELPHSTMAEWAVRTVLKGSSDGDGKGHEEGSERSASLPADGNQSQPESGKPQVKIPHYPLRFRCPVIQRESVAPPGSN